MAIPDFKLAASDMIVSAASFETTFGQFDAKKSPATSVFQNGARPRMAYPVHPPTSLCATASRLQNVLSQTNNATLLLVEGEEVRCRAVAHADTPPRLSP
eukprot:Pompholyxophrys_punicea_v1_NODE_1710_length_584_cov_1.591682.p2 type:complete len:100 gc:universal NODE_1710_length_584_cov_1.591682:108-407(+)